MPDSLDTMLMQILSCFLSDTADLVDRQRVEKCPDLFCSNRCQAVGLVHVRSHLRNRLVRRNPNAHREPLSRLEFSLHPSGMFEGLIEALAANADVHVGLVDTRLLELVSKPSQDFHGAIRGL